MAEVDTEQDILEDSLSNIFDQGMKLYTTVETVKEPMNSDSVQVTIKTAISKFEKATNLVSLSGMFSKNEKLEELPTETLKYMLLPALLGTLTLKICRPSRKDIIEVAEIYFKDFLQRCKDYGVTDVEIPQLSDSNSSSSRPQSQQDIITAMVQSRETKIKRYKEAKELKEKLGTLSKAMSSPIVDDEVKREYFLTMLHSYVNEVLDELSSIEREKPILEMISCSGEVPSTKEKPKARPLKPVIITRDAVQKAVFGIGYPSIPTMTVEEFYDQRVREGTFPGTSTNIPHTTIESTGDDADEAEKIRKERLVEEDDPEELERQRNMDEYKDEHRRGWGNRHNRS